MFSAVKGYIHYEEITVKIIIINTAFVVLSLSLLLFNFDVFIQFSFLIIMFLYHIKIIWSGLPEVFHKLIKNKKSVEEQKITENKKPTKLKDISLLSWFIGGLLLLNCSSIFILFVFHASIDILYVFSCFLISVKVSGLVVLLFLMFYFLKYKSKPRKQDLKMETDNKMASKLKEIENDIKSLDDLEYYELYLTENNYKLNSKLHKKLKKMKKSFLNELGYSNYSDYKRNQIVESKVLKENEIENL